ncbi:MAG: CRISPR-associated endonuclease Cas2 [Ruminococcus sp.]|nr:CRISPR-associated endonuclease Cas2 [Ruminococcus sp.]MCD7772503.1 CRISPR-associated endonuclease Cas2 [Ruminococcus sp.]
MLVLITYDVNTENKAGKARLRKVAKICVNYGQRVQNSVFECSLDPVQLFSVKDALLKVIDESCDSLRFYNLGKNYKNRIEHYGAKQTYLPDDPMIF